MQPISNDVGSALASAAQPTAINATPKPRPAPEPQKTEPPSFKDVEQAARRVEKFVQPMSSDLQFSVDESSGSSVVRVVDRANGEVIRQIPSEEMLAIASALDRLQGLLVRQKA